MKKEALTNKVDELIIALIDRNFDVISNKTEKRMMPDQIAEIEALTNLIKARASIDD